MNNVVFNIEPHTKPRMTRRDAWWQTAKEPRKCVVDYYAFKTKLNSLARKASFSVDDDLHITFFITMPSSWSGKKRMLMRNKPHQQSPDIDNLVKGFTDSLMQNDASIWRVQAAKYWSEVGSIQVDLL